MTAEDVRRYPEPMLSKNYHVRDLNSRTDFRNQTSQQHVGTSSDQLTEIDGLVNARRQFVRNLCGGLDFLPIASPDLPYSLIFHLIKIYDSCKKAKTWYAGKTAIHPNVVLSEIFSPNPIRSFFTRIDDFLRDLPNISRPDFNATACQEVYSIGDGILGLLEKMSIPDTIDLLYEMRQVWNKTILDDFLRPWSYLDANKDLTLQDVANDLKSKFQKLKELSSDLAKLLNRREQQLASKIPVSQPTPPRTKREYNTLPRGDKYYSAHYKIPQRTLTRWKKCNTPIGAAFVAIANNNKLTEEERKDILLMFSEIHNDKHLSANDRNKAVMRYLKDELDETIYFDAKDNVYKIGRR